MKNLKQIYQKIQYQHNCEPDFPAHKSTTDAEIIEYVRNKTARLGDERDISVQDVGAALERNISNCEEITTFMKKNSYTTNVGGHNMRSVHLWKKSSYHLRMVFRVVHFERNKHTMWCMGHYEKIPHLYGISETVTPTKRLA